LVREEQAALAEARQVLVAPDTKTAAMVRVTPAAVVAEAADHPRLRMTAQRSSQRVVAVPDTIMAKALRFLQEEPEAMATPRVPISPAEVAQLRALARMLQALREVLAGQERRRSQAQTAAEI
jgi:hypothetical protein